MSKYNARKTTLDGITFDSQKEANRYAELKLLQRAGLIEGLKLQRRFELQPAFTDATGRRQRAIYYVCDFFYRENGKEVIEDVKGVKTEGTKPKTYIRRLRAYRPQIDRKGSGLWAIDHLRGNLEFLDALYAVTNHFIRANRLLRQI